MTLHEKLTQEAHKFLKEEVKPRREAENARRFRAGPAQVKESIVIVPMRRIEPERSVNEETKFSPNSNGQGL